MTNLSKNTTPHDSLKGSKPSDEEHHTEKVTLPTRRTCGTMDLHHRLLNESEEYRLERSKIDNVNNKQ